MREVDSLRVVVATVNHQADSLAAILRQAQGINDGECHSTTPPIALRKSAVETLERKGLRDPLLDLSRDLAQHPELLPQERRCEQGGAFRYYQNCMYLLSDNWVMAYFEDGLCAGYVLLEFTVDNSGAVAWKRLAWTPA